MALSVYGRKTHEVLIMTYLIVVVWIMAPVLVEIAYEAAVGPPPSAWTRANLWTLLHEWAEWSNPYFLALAPYSMPGKVGDGDLPGIPGGLPAGLGRADGPGDGAGPRRGARARRVGRRAGRALAAAPARPASWLPALPGPSLDVNPVAWREWHRTRPSLMMRVAWGLYAALGLLWVWVACGADRPACSSTGSPSMNTVQVTIGLLLLSVGAATSLAEERVRGSLDVLLSTPMSTRSILAGKWWGSFRRVLSVAIWPAATSIVLAPRRRVLDAYLALLGLVLAYGAAITSLGLALATWVSRLGRAVALCVTILCRLDGRLADRGRLPRGDTRDAVTPG